MEHAFKNEMFFFHLDEGDGPGTSLMLSSHQVSIQFPSSFVQNQSFQPNNVGFWSILFYGRELILKLFCFKSFLQKLTSKNFSGEIRAAKDVEIFLERPTLLLELHETSLQGIVDTMLNKMIADSDGEDIDFDTARMAFFTHDSG